MIYENSRYEFEKIVRVVDHTGTVNPAVYVSPDIDRWRFLYDSAVVAEGSRLDVVAERVYGDPEKWWVIAKANPEIFYPDDFPLGTRLRIPYAR